MGREELVLEVLRPLSSCWLRSRAFLQVLNPEEESLEEAEPFNTPRPRNQSRDVHEAYLGRKKGRGRLKHCAGHA